MRENFGLPLLLIPRKIKILSQSFFGSPQSNLFPKLSFLKSPTLADVSLPFSAPIPPPKCSSVWKKAGEDGRALNPSLLYSRGIKTRTSIYPYSHGTTETNISIEKKN